jgi:hypothetical protein
MASLLLTSLLVIAQAEKPADDAVAKEQQQNWNDYCAKVAADYVITRRKQQAQRLELKPEPVLFWSNPIRPGETNGSVFVWTYEGRSALVGTIFSHLVRGSADQKVIAHEFQSLTGEPLEGSRPAAPGTWSLAGGGLQARPIPGAPPPATTAAGRLPQMRNLAREFSATTSLEGVEQELRLLPQPIHRNEKSVGDVLDGALFTFVTGTDPELMLVIEARPAASGEAPVWHYTAGRFTDLTLNLRHKGVALWTFERGTTPDPYVCIRPETLPKLMP